uniref:Spindle and kinetochore-associated protein 3 n=1 Tax=Sphenodon punctatus TaxID=8508 RepID=A0A8D0HD18_SPHPU
MSDAATGTKSREIMATPGQTIKMPNENGVDYMASPAIPVFCTPGMKIPFRKNVASPISPEKKELSIPNRAATPTLPDLEIHKRAESKANKTKSVPNKQHTEDYTPSTLCSDKYLEHLGAPSPPTISDYGNLLDTPPPPEVTEIPQDILQILSKYNSKTNTLGIMKKQVKTGIAAKFERDVPGYSNKENREYSGCTEPGV